MSSFYVWAIRFPVRAGKGLGVSWRHLHEACAASVCFPDQFPCSEDRQ